MPLSKKQKQMIGVLAVCLIALVGDRLFVLETPSSDAATADAALDETTPPPTTQRSERNIRWGSRTGSARLTAATKQHATELAASRDIFRPQVEESLVQAAERPGAKPAMDAATLFMTDHKLKAVFRRGNDSIALVGEQMVRLGEGVAGFKLVALEPKAALFERGGVRVRLTLSEPDRVLTELK